MFGRRKHRDLVEPSAAPPGGEVVANIDDDSFLAGTEGGYTIVDFWAPWCSPCRAFAPIFEDVAARSGERVRFARCNVDESPVTATMLQIRSIPTVVAFGPDGSELGRIVGIPRRADLEKAVTELEHPAQT
jgi:thioredoxin 1